MNDKPLSVHEVARLTGITVRTLHYYDEIKLLKPTIVTDAKYRLYTNDDLSKLQEVLFFREVGFALKEIKSLITAHGYNREEALKRHIKILKAQQQRIDELIELVNDKISGKQEYSFEAFSTSKILELQAQFRDEIIESWSDTNSCKEFTDIFSKESRKSQQEKWNEYLSKTKIVFELLAEYENENPSKAEVQEIVKGWQEYIFENFYECNNQMLSYLGELYVTDERFSSFINRFGKGDLASFFNRAIKVFCSQEREYSD